ncbi:unnamed protein product [Symbiodinium sp. CCMP2456]|nr:unnamed protein product [Symbiodinium sp. CCMP2456]
MQADQMKVLLQSVDGRIFGCSSGRVVRVLPSSPPRVLLVYDTTTYRRLAKTQVGKDDGILEVGSSFGECTSILASHAAVVIGVDNSPKLVEESSRRYPECRFELLDCFKEPARLRLLCAEIQRASSNFKLFVDIGGDRMTSGVCHALVVLESLWCRPGSEIKQPSLVVVKSEGLSEAAAVACVETRQYFSEKRVPTTEMGRGYFVALNDAEIQSVHVYEGACPEAWLRCRVAEIVEANPWLAGRLKRDPESGRLALWIQRKIDSQKLLEVVAVSDTAAVVGNCSKHFFVKSGCDLVDADEPICRFVVLIEPKGLRWGLQVSMSHMLTDGHTFYAIYSMLDSNAEVWSMEVTRVKFDPMRCLHAPFHGKWLFFVLQHLRSQIGWKRTSHMPIVQCRYVRDDWVQKQKAAFQAQADVAFVSSNDLLTSWFLKATQPSCAALLLNMRNRMQGLEDKHAGCYASMLLFFPEEYKSPANIRRAITRQSPACTPTGQQQWPGRGSKVGMVTSWHMLYHDVAFDGCKQLTHFPCGPRNLAVKPQVPFAALFAPSEGSLAMLTMTEKELPFGVLGDAVWGSDALFQDW